MRLYQRFLPYAVAMSLTAIAFLLSLWLEPLLVRTVGAFFYIAIILSTGYGSFRAGIVAVILSTVAIDYAFIPPKYQFVLTQPQDFLRLGVFLVVALMINLLNSRLVESKKKIERLSQQLAQENAEQLRIALSAAQMGMWDWNILTGELKASPEAEQLSGWVAGTYDQRYETFLARLHPEDVNGFNQAVAQAIQTHQIYQYEYRIIWLDGSIHWVEGRGQTFYNETGQAVRMMGTIINIDERKQTQLDLKKSNIELEQRVLERTGELTQTSHLLEQSETQFQYLVANVPGGIYTIIHAPDGSVRFDYVSPAFCAIFEWESEPILNNSSLIFEQFYLEDIPVYKALLTHSLQTLEPLEHELRIITPSGQLKWVHARAVAHLQADGSIIRYGIVRDISERKQIEESLEKTLQQLSFHIENTPLATVIWDSQMRVQYWSKQAEKILGWTAEEVFGKTMYEWQFIFERDEEMVNRKAQDLFRGQPIICRNRNYRKDGTVIDCEWYNSALLDESGNLVSVLSFAQDITQRNRLEQALKVSEEKYRQIIDLANEGVWIIDAEGYTTFVNPRMAEMLGYTVAEMMDQSLFVFMDEEERAFATAQLEARRQGISEQHDFKFRCKDGSELWCIIGTNPIINEAGQFMGALGMITDISDRKRIEKALLDSEEKFRQMMMGIVEIYPHDIFHLSSNLATTEFFGIESDTLQNHFASEIGVQQEYIEMWLNYYREAECTGVPVKFQYLHRTETTQKWLSATVCPIVNSSTHRTLFSFVVEDITERKHAEEALRQKSRKEELLFSITQAIRQSLDLHAILNNAVTQVRQTLQTDRAAIYQFNPDWSGDFVIESVAPGWLKLVGDQVQKSWEDTYLQDTQGGRFRNKENFIVNDIYTAGLQPCHIELLEQFQAKSYAVFPIFLGETVWGLLAIYQNSTSRQWQSWEIELLQEIASQLSIAIQQSDLYRQLKLELQERKQTEAVLREAERRWRSLLDNVQLIVVELDCNGNINYVNPFLLSLTGYDKTEVLGQSWFEKFCPNEIQDSMQVVFSEILTQNHHPYYRNAILTKSGETRLIAWNNTVLQDLQGKIIGMISIGEDVTERQKIEKIKDEFIGIVSHELRTPLTAIQMSLGLLNTGIYAQKPEKFRRMIEIALLDTKRLVNLVNDILDLERLESGRAILDKTVCNATDLMQQAVDGIQAIASQEQISLVIILSDAEVWVAADAIIQTLTNLLSNAMKFSPAHSTIHLSAEPQADCVLFKVRDHGRGIPTDKLEAIFGRFQQVDGSDSREKGGTGLGLAICRSIIEQHGGRIWAESILNEGSTFFFTLPFPVKF
ncbi:Sensor histidine kinase WalK [Planktothrix tepida]|uniref:histidine kinase n=1 Tax=Planktothrix tepida PCC 9214 TaxID=671072 RepID=A0A1J1LR94_9CYAN